jgi:hypothetical protein
MGKIVQMTPLQQKPTSPTWQIECPFSELAFTGAGAGADSGAQPGTQNFKNSGVLFYQYNIFRVMPKLKRLDINSKKFA